MGRRFTCAAFAAALLAVTAAGVCLRQTFGGAALWTLTDANNRESLLHSIDLVGQLMKI